MALCTGTGPEAVASYLIRCISTVHLAHTHVPSSHTSESPQPLLFKRFLVAVFRQQETEVHVWFVVCGSNVSP